MDFLNKTLYNELTLTEKGECHITLQPNNFALEPTTVWSFKDRGIGQHTQGSIVVIGHHMCREI